MKKTFLSIISILIIIVFSSIVLAAATQWVVGEFDGSVNPIVGADEYPANGQWYPSFDYNINSSVAAPAMPGYIAPANVCNFVNDGRACTDSTARLNLNFYLQCPVGNATFVYGRYGSETDQILLDGVELNQISAGGEGNFSEETYDLGYLTGGTHTISIVYVGGGSNNGHYIDSVSLKSEFNCLVDIDIKPNSDPSSVNLNGHGVIPVAILGSATFDVNNIDVPTVQFEGVNARTKGNGDYQCSNQDTNGDGYIDLVCQYPEDDSYLTLQLGDVIATVTGQLLDGTPFEGTGDINIVTK